MIPDEIKIPLVLCFVFIVIIVSDLHASDTKKKAPDLFGIIAGEKHIGFGVGGYSNNFFGIIECYALFPYGDPEFNRFVNEHHIKKGEEALFDMGEHDFLGNYTGYGFGFDFVLGLNYFSKIITPELGAGLNIRNEYPVYQVTNWNNDENPNEGIEEGDYWTPGEPYQDPYGDKKFRPALTFLGSAIAGFSIKLNSDNQRISFLYHSRLGPSLRIIVGTGN